MKTLGAVKHGTLFWTNFDPSLSHFGTHPLKYTTHLGTAQFLVGQKSGQKGPVPNLSQFNKAYFKVCISVCMRIYVFLELCMYTCILYIYVCTHTYMYVVTVVLCNFHAYIHAYIYSYIIIYMHTHTHTYMDA